MDNLPTSRLRGTYLPICIAIGALFVARMALESVRRPVSWPVVVLAGLSAAALGYFVTRHWLTRRNAVTACALPMLLLLPYLLWPRRDLALACQTGVLALLTWLCYAGSKANLPASVEGWADGITFAIAATIYLATVAPDLLPADAGEFQLATALLGVLHPPGYPLYTIVGHLFIRFLPLPGTTPAYRLNLLSGLLAAGTLIPVARATRIWARQLGASRFEALVGGVVASLALGSATTFWAQATVANIRTPAIFLAALALYALARFSSPREPAERERSLVLFGVFLGLGGGHYPPLAFVSLFFLLYMVLCDPCLVRQPWRWRRPLLAGACAFLLPLVYLPIRGAMGAPLAPEGLDTVPGFLHHFLARGFAGDMFAFANSADLLQRLTLVPTLFLFQFNPLLLVMALGGLLGLLWREWRLFLLMAGALTVHTFVTITYRAPQTVEYLMPAYLPVAIAIGLLPALCSHYITALPWHTLFLPLLYSLPLWAGLLNGWVHAPSFFELASDRSTRELAGAMLKAAPPGALILADWHWAMPLRYLQEVEGQRPDVEVQYVWPVAGMEYHQIWEQRLRSADAGRPVLLTHFYEFDGYTVEPLETAFLLRPRPVMTPTAPLVPLAQTFGGLVELVGYTLRGAPFQPGEMAEIVLAWRPTGPLSVPPSFTLRLIDEHGHQVAQADRWLGTDAMPGEIRFERLFLPLYLTLPPGRYRIVVGAYITGEAGFEDLLASEGSTTTELTGLELQPLSGMPFTLRRFSVPFDSGPLLRGADFDRSIPDTLRVYLHWQGPSDEERWVRIHSTDGAEAIASLPPLPAGAYQTIALDMPGGTSGPLWLSLEDAANTEEWAAGAWGWPLQELCLPMPSDGALFVPLGNEMAVTGVQVQRTRSDERSVLAPAPQPAEAMAVDVMLVGLRPLVDDYSTSVRLTDTTGQRLAMHDYQPALGAIPTLKWIRGSRVVDRHIIPLPTGSAGKAVQATLVVYERFRLAPLPVPDGRLTEVSLGTFYLPEAAKR